MTVPPVSANDTTPAAQAPSPAPQSPVEPAPGFDQLFVNAQHRAMPSVGLDTMLARYAQASTPPSVGADTSLFGTGRANSARFGGMSGPASSPFRAIGPTATSNSPGVTGGSAHSVTATNRTSGADPWGVASARPSQVNDPVGRAVLSAGERYLGVPYKWGGTSASTGFDCSGFVQQVYSDLGISLPRVSIDQSRQGVGVGDLSHARPGDLVFWQGSQNRPNHIGIYAGEGRMLVAPRTGDVVRYQEISRTPDAIRRIVV